MLNSLRGISLVFFAQVILLLSSLIKGKLNAVYFSPEDLSLFYIISNTLALSTVLSNLSFTQLLISELNSPQSVYSLTDLNYFAIITGSVGTVIYIAFSLISVSIFNKLYFLVGVTIIFGILHSYYNNILIIKENPSSSFLVQLASEIFVLVVLFFVLSSDYDDSIKIPIIFFTYTLIPFVFSTLKVGKSLYYKFEINIFLKYFKFINQSFRKGFSLIINSVVPLLIVFSLSHSKVISSEARINSILSLSILAPILVLYQNSIDPFIIKGKGLISKNTLLKSAAFSILYFFLISIIFYFMGDFLISIILDKKYLFLKDFFSITIVFYFFRSIYFIGIRHLIFQDESLKTVWYDLFLGLVFLSSFQLINLNLIGIGVLLCSSYLVMSALVFYKLFYKI
jgi:O-antigen/teichoic acid export membrane protein